MTPLTTASVSIDARNYHIEREVYASITAASRGRLAMRIVPHRNPGTDMSIFSYLGGTPQRSSRAQLLPDSSVHKTR